MSPFVTALPFLLAYLLGSVSFAVLVSKMVGLADPRTYGSQNPGATNVLRSGNKTAAALTLLGDALKGTAAVLLAQHFQARLGLSLEHLPWVGLAAFLGHLYPVFLKFKGGKGVATALGVLLGLNWMLGLATAATWLLVAKVSRYSSLAAMVASVCAIGYQAWFDGPSWGTLAIALMTALLLYRHKSNIRQLLAGTEGKIGQKSRRLQ